MNIIVFIKQVPDTTDVKFDDNGMLKREGLGTVINPFDLYAIEEGLKIKEKTGGKVIVITMGPDSAKDVLKNAIGMGADEAVIVTDDKAKGADTIATAKILAKAAQKAEYNLIICGMKAVDGDTGQVGPAIAAVLGVPSITMVNKVKEVSDSSITAERLMEDGSDVVKTPLPAVITVVKGINDPRLESLKGKMKAKKTQIPAWSLADIGSEASSLTKVTKSWAPEKKSVDSEKIEGSPEEIADKVFNAIKEIKG